MGGFFSKTVIEPDHSRGNTGSHGMHVPPTGSLAKILQSLKDEQTVLEVQTAEWKVIREKLFSVLSGLELPEISPEEESSIVSAFRRLFAEMTALFRDVFEPTEEKIHHLITAAALTIKQTFLALERACKVVNDPDQTARAQAEAKFDIADDCVVSLLSLNRMLGDICSEIELGIAEERMSEGMAMAMLQFAMLFFAKIPLPTTDFSLNTAWQEFLARNLSGDLHEIGRFELDVERALAKAMDVLQMKSPAKEAEAPPSSADRPGRRFFQWANGGKEVFSDEELSETAPLLKV